MSELRIRAESDDGVCSSRRSEPAPTRCSRPAGSEQLSFLTPTNCTLRETLHIFIQDINCRYKASLLNMSAEQLLISWDLMNNRRIYNRSGW